MKFFVLKILMVFDFFHKKKILKALKDQLSKHNNIIIFDVGGHHGESIFFFNQNFDTSKIYTFEPIKDNFLKLKKKNKKYKRESCIF